MDLVAFVFINQCFWWLYSIWPWKVCSLLNTWLSRNKTESKVLDCCCQARVPSFVPRLFTLYTFLGLWDLFSWFHLHVLHRWPQYPHTQLRPLSSSRLVEMTIYLPSPVGCPLTNCNLTNLLSSSIPYPLHYLTSNCIPMCFSSVFQVSVNGAVIHPGPIQMKHLSFSTSSLLAHA